MTVHLLALMGMLRKQHVSHMLYQGPSIHTAMQGSLPYSLHEAAEQNLGPPVRAAQLHCLLELQRAGAIATTHRPRLANGGYMQANFLQG